jgi:hypothetical protein
MDNMAKLIKMGPKAYKDLEKLIVQAQVFAKGDKAYATGKDFRTKNTKYIVSTTEFEKAGLSLKNRVFSSSGAGSSEMYAGKSNIEVQTVFKMLDNLSSEYNRMRISLGKL